MPPIPSAPLNILTFPQLWQAATRQLTLNVLVLTKGDPLNDFAPPFPDASMAFNAHLVGGLEQLPMAVPAGPGLEIVQDPAERRAFFDELLRVLNLVPGFRVVPSTGIPGPQQPAGVRKYLTSSFHEANRFAPRRTRVAVVDSSYECALREDPGTVTPDDPKPELYWPEILGFVLRQPQLAVKLGLIYRTRLTLDDPNPFVQGGYLYADLAATSDLLGVGRQLFAARLPALPDASDRVVFAPVLFPVDLPDNYDQAFPEVELYDDGFAKLVHGSQPERAAQIETSHSTLPAVKDIGIRLAWDDEQVAIWLNRQLGINALDTPPPPSPLGVGGYRVDVFDDVNNDWQSLVHVSSAELRLGDLSIGPFDGELAVEVIPINPNNQPGGEFWLPSYFTAWAGASLAIADPTPFALADRLVDLGERVYTPVNADRVALRYGNSYRFRIRLTDLTGGGPDVLQHPLTPAPRSEAKVSFRRFVPPKAATITVAPDRPIQGSAHFDIARPDLAYPDVVFTGKYADPVNLLLAQVAAARAAEVEPALPDPDVTHLRVEVQVRTLTGDPAATASGTGQPYAPLYSAVRAFPAAFEAALGVDFQFRDTPNLSAMRGIVVADGDPLPLPTARDIRLLFTPLGSEDADLRYWGNQEVRVGAAPVEQYVRAAPLDERNLFVPPVAPEIQAIFLQPDPPPTSKLLTVMALEGLKHEAPSDLVSRLAHHLNLPVAELTFGSPPGRRVVYGCASTLRHSLNPDGSSLTFSARTDLTQHWIVAVRLTLDRDWTWDALEPVAFELQREVGGGAPSTVATIAMPRMVNPLAVRDPDRDHTNLVIFDSFDPKPAPGVPLVEPRLVYSLVPRFAAAVPVQADAPRSWPLTLPITTPPTQVPRIKSAGLAFSEYQHDDHYTTTDERRRMLFVELEGPPLDPRDRYFVRVLAYGPDPVLIDHDAELPSPPEPPLPIDAELIRAIVPHQSNDHAGLNAMQVLEGSPESDRHYVVPLPPGLGADSPELFGFFVCELRVGHDGTRWCTAQGRFGHPLRITGVQYPAPQLRCAVTRTDLGIAVSAPFATPVWNGRTIRPAPQPRSKLYALLYAQVMQVDGEAWRNVLLLRAPARVDLEGHDHVIPVDPRLAHGLALFGQDDILHSLRVLGLSDDASLSVLIVETLPEPESPFQEPVGADLGQVRFLRTSTLTPVPAICPPSVAI